MILSAQAKKLYADTFGNEDGISIFYSHGRLELLGNHTDHQGGTCLVAGCDLGITAAVRPNPDGAIRVISEGYAPFLFHLDELALKKGETGTTISLFKGVIARMKHLGYKAGGFTAALRSDLPAGSGLSSSAALEALIAEIEDVLYNDGKIEPLTKARIGQWAENYYFGKPCGLLDQIGVCFGGVAYVDFGKEDVFVEPFAYGLRTVHVLDNTGGTHANLTDAYASIPADMCLVAREMFGVERLSQASERDFLARVGDPRYASVSPKAKLRAQHYFDEVKRVEDARKALQRSDAPSFLEDVRRSQFSSQQFLGNTMVPGCYEHSPQQAVDIANQIIGQGAARIMGGGFAGSIICFVYPEDLPAFTAAMARYYGADNVRALSIVDGGAKQVEA